MATINWSLQHKRDTAANWTANNPTLLAGQIGIETDGLTTTPKFKIGDGSTAWNTLPYFYGGALSAQNLSNVLGVGNTTSGNDIELTDADSIVLGTTPKGYISYSPVLANPAFYITNAGGTDAISFRDAGGIYVDTTTGVYLPQLTASRILSLDANNKISSSFNTTGSGSTLVLSTSPTFTTDITTPEINGVTNALTINAATTLLYEMYLGTSASRGIWSWNASTVILRSGSSAVNFTIGTPAYTTNIVSYNATGNVAIGGVADNATDQLQVSNHIGTPVLNLRGRSGAAPTQLNFIPFDATNSIIKFKNTSGTTRGFIDLNIYSGEMKFWGSSGGYFPTFGSNGSERMRIDTNGNVVVNTAAIATNATSGFLYIPSCAGTPTGVPTSFTGRVPMVYDSTNNRFYIYNGAWRSVLLS